MAETTGTSRTRTRRKIAEADRSTAARKAAATGARRRATEARTRSTAAKQAAKTRRDAARTPVERYAGYAGRAVVIPVGAALVARDTVVATVEASRERAERELRARRRRVEAELRTFEVRGASARSSLERDVRSARTRLEREARERRNDVRSGRAAVGARAGLVTSRIEGLMQSGIAAGTHVAAKATERVARGIR